MQGMRLAGRSVHGDFCIPVSPTLIGEPLSQLQKYLCIHDKLWTPAEIVPETAEPGSLGRPRESRGARVVLAAISYELLEISGTVPPTSLHIWRRAAGLREDRRFLLGMPLHP
eukprot:s1665_g21.t1